MIRPYLRLLLAGFRQESAYLAAAFAGIVANVTFGFLKAAVLVATVEAAGGELAGYGTGQMLAFVWIGQALLGMVNLSGRDELGERIKSGDITVDFLRPLDVQLAGLATFLGRRLFTLLPRGIPTFAIGLLTTGMLLPHAVTPYVLGAVSVLLGVVLSYLGAYALNVLGFWLVETRGLTVAYMVLAGFLSGLYVPVVIFPEWLRWIATATPFPSMLMTPIDVLTARVTGAEAAYVVLVQVLWLVAVGALGAVLTRAGRRHLEVQGG